MNTPSLINVAVAVIAAMVIFAAINRMSRDTVHAVRCSILMLFVAMLGQAIALPMRQWDAWTDTLLYGAVAAFVVASRRLPSGLPTPHASAIAFAIMGATLAVAVLIGVLW